MSSINFSPNTNCGPCLYCAKFSENKPEELVSCDLCRRPLHMTCLKNGSPQTTLLGDNFFHATCSACSTDGKDSVRRAYMSSIQMLLLVTYNLHMKQAHNSKFGFFHWKIHIGNMLIKHWKEIDIQNSYKKRRKMVQNALSGQLAYYTRYFHSGQTILGEGGWYKLISVVPPAVALMNSGSGGDQEERKLTSDLPSVSESTIQEPSPSPSSPSTVPSIISIKKEKGGQNEWDCSSSSKTEALAERGLILPDFVSSETRMGEDCRGREGEEEERDVTNFEVTLRNLKQEEIVKEEVNVDDQMEDQEDYEENVNVDEEVYTAEHVISKCEEERGGGGVHYKDEMLPSLFPPPSCSLPVSPYMKEKVTKYITRNVRCLSRYEERTFLRHLERLRSSQPLPPHVHRLRRKLVVRSQKAEHGLPLFNLDQEIIHWRQFGRIRSKRERMESNDMTDCTKPPSIRVLDRFQVARQWQGVREEHNISFAARLGSSCGDDVAPPHIHSPYTLRYLKPYIRRDYDSKPLKLQLLREIVSAYHQNESEWQMDPSPPIDYCYVTARHIPAMNQLARHFFWPGIDLSEVLQYPDHTCVVLYRHLVIGFGVVVPDTGYNEAYLSFLLVHPEWRRAGIATFLLYHLVQTCMGKDVTLHVSATNPALILYQQFGFKVEEFLSNFYDKYIPHDSPECKHAMLMRLRR